MSTPEIEVAPSLESLELPPADPRPLIILPSKASDDYGRDLVTAAHDLFECMKASGRYFAWKKRVLKLERVNGEGRWALKILNALEAPGDFAQFGRFIMWRAREGDRRTLKPVYCRPNVARLLLPYGQKFLEPLPCLVDLVKLLQAQGENVVEPILYPTILRKALAGPNGDNQ